MEQQDYDAAVVREERIISLLTDCGLSLGEALSVVGVSKSMYYYRSHPRPRVENPIDYRLRDPKRIDQVQRGEIAALCKQARHDNKSIKQAFFEHIDDANQKYLGSMSSFYRIDRQLCAQGAYGSAVVVSQPRKRSYVPVMPVVKASKPGQVIVWDVTWIKGFYQRQKWPLYSFMDLYSRKIVGWTIQYRESGDIASQLFAQIIKATKLELDEDVALIHSDNGGPMTSKEMDGVLTEFGITQSLNRPSVSNDNPHSESSHRTIKHHRFVGENPTDIDQAYELYGKVIDAYNTTDYHSGIANFAPEQVWNGTYLDIAGKRHAKLLADYAAHPDRYTHQPKIQLPPTQVTINAPKPAVTYLK